MEPGCLRGLRMLIGLKISKTRVITAEPPYHAQVCEFPPPLESVRSPRQNSHPTPTYRQSIKDSFDNFKTKNFLLCKISISC